MSNNNTATTRVITIRLRIPALVLISTLFVGGLVWAFVLGIMVGRGQINEQLEALRPATTQTASDNSTEKAAPDAAQPPADEIEKLIKAEDLKYQESLRQNSPAPTGSTVSAAPAAPSTSAQVAPQATAGQQYSYLYQVASYTKEPQAQDTLSKLKARGVDAQIETKIIQGTSWFRILISIKGDENSVKNMQEMLKKDFKINSILLRSKTALGR